MRYFSKREVGDPSEIQQSFISINLQVWCCRYWKLSQWDCNDMSFPYWRMYWNKNKGGLLSYKGKTYEPDENTLLIIPPNTPFQAYYKQNHMFETGIHVHGKRITLDDDEMYISNKYLLHFFTHFTLGAPFDNVESDIYPIHLTEEQKNRVQQLTNYLKTEVSDFSLQANLIIQSVVSEMLYLLPKHIWTNLTIESRIMDCIRYIERNIHLNLNNKVLANKLGLATNSFIRLFKSEMNASPQEFIKTKKMAKACALLDHTEMTIDEIANYLGFADRYHFSRVFKSNIGNSPAAYRKGNLN